jgi:hypothetical protein
MTLFFLLDIIQDKNSRSTSSSRSIDEKVLHRSEQESSPTTTFSMIESIQNLFQRIIKPSSSSSSTPSTPKLSHPDPSTFRIRPFPMSSYNNEQININPNNKRFYHVFKRGELEMLIEEASKNIVGLKIIRSFYDHGNWCAVVQKDVNMCLL